MALDLGNKVENQGTTQHGRLTAAEWNRLVDQVNKNTPVYVPSEEALQSMIESGLIVPGQIYYIPEEE